jgi:uncharacterized membrane protein
MQLLGWLILALLLLVALFSAANWALLTTAAPIDLLLVTVQASPGLVLLSAILVIVLLFGVYVVSLRTATIIETRRHLKALEIQRELADKAEASRFTALAGQIEQQLAATRALIEETRAHTDARIDALDASLARTLNDTANAVFANLGQVDDKLDRLSQAAR